MAKKVTFRLKFIRFSRKLFRIKPPRPPRKDFKKQTIQRVLQKQRYRCRHCNTPLREIKGLKTYHVDHIHRRDDNRILNCQILCPNCHTYKGINDRLNN